MPNTTETRGTRCPLCRRHVDGGLKTRGDVFRDGYGACGDCLRLWPEKCQICDGYIPGHLTPVTTAAGLDLWLCDYCRPRVTGTAPKRCERCGIPTNFEPYLIPGYQVADGPWICEHCLNADLRVRHCGTCGGWSEEVQECEGCGELCCISCFDDGVHEHCGKE